MLDLLILLIQHLSIIIVWLPAASLTAAPVSSAGRRLLCQRTRRQATRARPVSCRTQLWAAIGFNLLEHCVRSCCRHFLMDCTAEQLPSTPLHVMLVHLGQLLLSTAKQGLYYSHVQLVMCCPMHVPPYPTQALPDACMYIPCRSFLETAHACTAPLPCQYTTVHTYDMPLKLVHYTHPHLQKHQPNRH